MATKTLILRPHIVNFEDETLITLYPSGTSITNASILVDDEVADDDSTYILGSKGSVIYYSFRDWIPEDLGAITDFKIYSRCKAEVAGTSNQSNPFSFVYNGDGTDGTRIAYLSQYLGKDTEYVTKTFDESINDETLLSHLYNMIISSYISFDIMISQNIDTDSKSNPIRITQVYIEITYETKKTFKPIYLKSNNIWTPIQGTIYQKTNGVWTETTPETLQNNTKYLINNIT